MPAGEAEIGRRIPCLVPGCDPTRLSLSPAQGYLLSRIDGATSQALLREFGGLPRAEVDACLEDWAEQGVVVFAGPPRSEADVTEAEPPPAADAALDASLQIELEAQRAVLDMEARLDRPYHEILGVARDADSRVIKRAYFALSKEFHPDRYFRREIGPYRERVTRVFRKIVEAYELLSDPSVRAEMERSLGAVAEAEPEAAAVPEPVSAARPARAARASAKQAPAAKAAKPAKARRKPLPLGPLARMLAERRTKARTFFEAGMASAAAERWIEAAGSLRLAIAFDPGSAAYRERFSEIQPRAHEVRFEQLVKEADNALSFKDRGDALRIFEEALHFRPWDGRTNHVAAQLSWLVAGDLRRAREYAARACEAEPEQAEYRRTLGQIYKAAGLKANARRELERALRLDPKDAQARAELKSL